MYRLVVFDLDKTLCPLGKGIADENLTMLRALEKTGVRIAICSGKPTYYLCGLMRQVGLERPVLVGENGAVIQFGVDLPPREYEVLPYSQAAKESIRLMRDTLERELPGMWYQPNVTGLTPFPKDEAEFARLTACVERMRPRMKDVLIYLHCDCYDITPCGVTKASGLARLCELLGVTPGETIAVGDDVNDYPMFSFAGLALGVNVKEPERVAQNFASTGEMLSYLLEMQKK